jgi:hypothetical protein
MKQEQSEGAANQRNSKKGSNKTKTVKGTSIKKMENKEVTKQGNNEKNIEASEH